MNAKPGLFLIRADAMAEIATGPRCHCSRAVVFYENDALGEAC